MIRSAAALLAWPRHAYPFAQSPVTISKFAVPLPGLGDMGIPVLTAEQDQVPGNRLLRNRGRPVQAATPPAIPTATFFGYADAATKNHRYLGGVIVATRGTPVKLKITNPAKHILPVDPTLVDPTMLAETGGRPDRICVHLHGGFVSWDSDGGLFRWFSNTDNPGGFVHGSSFVNGVLYPESPEVNDHIRTLRGSHERVYIGSRCRRLRGSEV